MQREFERAMREGTLVRSEGSKIPLTDVNVLAELAERAKARATKAISIRVPVADLERAQQIAAREGTGYQTILKRAIRAGLKKVS
jgi:predicted DNA binding CopG/RHH family protein